MAVGATGGDAYSSDDGARGRSKDNSAPNDPYNTSLSYVIKSASHLKERRHQDEQIRTEDVREWSQNREFYKGNQWVFWNRVLNRVEALPVQDAEKPRYKVRLKDNRIRRGVTKWIAQMTKNKPIIFATPESSSTSDAKAAEMAQALYEHLWRELDLDSELQRALMFAAVSQGYWEITYDPHAGKPVRNIVNPQTGEPLDGPIAELLLENAAKEAERQNLPFDAVMQHIEKITKEGEISVRALPGEAVLVDPTAETHEHAKYCFTYHVMTPDEIWGRWKVRVQPDAIPLTAQPALLYQKQTDKRPKSVRRVFCGYFRPSVSLPKGRYVVWIENPDKILYEGAWPFPFDELPIVKFPGHYSTEGPLDLPPTTEARPIQQELNRSISQVVEHKDLTLRPQMVAPVGSLRTRLTAEPGAVFEYQPIAGLQPEWRPIPALPAYVFEHIQNIAQMLDECYNALPNQRDQMPARIDSGQAIDALQETASDDLLPPIRRLEAALAKAGWLIAMLAQKNYSEPRLISMKGANGSMAMRRFQAADLRGGFTFHAEAGSGLPRTRAGKQARIEFLLQNQLIDQETALKYLDMADMTGVLATIEADEDMALREHDRLIKGEPISAAMVQQAQQQVNDPNADPDGDGLPDREFNPGYYQQWAQQVVSQAALQPIYWENPEVHVRVHQQFMATEEFEKLPLDAQNRFIQHYDLSYQRLIQLRFMQPTDSPKIQLRLEGSTSAPVQAAILRKNGVMVDLDEVTQPPLPLVTDNPTQMLQQAIGFQQQVQQGQQQMQQQQAQGQQQLQQQAEMHQAGMAQQAHAAALAATKVQLAQQQAQAHALQVQQQQAQGQQQQMSQQALQQQALDHAEQMHQARMQQVKQAPGRASRTSRGK